MLKRLFDMFVSIMALTFFSPVLLFCMYLVWRQDRHSPFYISDRVGIHEKNFRMIKLRSMIKNADKSGVDSTSSNDMRITKVGQFIRKYKIDELSQLINVFIGDMSLVGPRPNVKRETDLYTIEEKKLLSVKPGITDFSSIVFSDEGDILKDKEDPDVSYNQLIRPWKSRLGLIYIENQSILLDMKLIFLTAIAIFSRSCALKGVKSCLEEIQAPLDLINVCQRKDPLIPTPPPGMLEIVTHR